VYYTAEEILVQRVPYGWIIKTGILLFVLTILLCSISYEKWELDFHTHELDHLDEVVTVTASGGYISAYIRPPENGNWHLITSNSSVPVDTFAQTEDGSYSLVYDNLQPGGSFWFEFVEPCVVTFVAS
jgi:hypothetical protein